MIPGIDVTDEQAFSRWLSGYIDNYVKVNMKTSHFDTNTQDLRVRGLHDGLTNNNIPVWTNGVWVPGLVGTNSVSTIDISKVAPTIQFARASATQANFGTGPTDVTGCTLTSTVTGTYLVFATFDMTVQVAGNSTAAGTIVASGGTLTATTAHYLIAAGGPIARATLPAQGTWVCTAVSQTIKLQIGKNVAAATFDSNITDTSIMILRIA